MIIKGCVFFSGTRNCTRSARRTRGIAADLQYALDVPDAEPGYAEKFRLRCRVHIDREAMPIP